MNITVTGSATRAFAPERAVLLLEVDVRGSDQAEVRERATGVATQVSDMIEELNSADPSPITWSAVLPITNSYWKDSDTHEIVHNATGTIKIRFSDFEALSTVIERCGKLEGLDVRHVSWELTEDTSNRYHDEILTDAVADARSRAQVMASAAGRGEVRIVSLSDPGLFSSGGHGGAMTRNAYMGSGHSDGLSLRPEDIEISDSVVAVFEA